MIKDENMKIWMRSQRKTHSKPIRNLSKYTTTRDTATLTTKGSSLD